MKVKYYNVHNIVTFKIVDKTNFLHRFLSSVDKAYENFECADIEHPDIIIYIGKFAPNNQDCYILDDRFYIRKDYLYCEADYYKFARWTFELSDFESGNIIIHISSNLIGSMFIRGNIIGHVIHYKMTEKGYNIIHSSAISKDGNAFLFPARSGSGKTVIALHFLEKGFKFLGDNFVILHENKILNFLSPLAIFTYNLAPIIRRKLGLKKRFVLALKGLLHKMTKGYIKIFTNINPKDFFPDMIDNGSKLDSIFLLIPGGNLHIEKINIDELIEHQILNQQLDSFPFWGYMLEYSYMFPESKMATYWARYRENINKNLSKDIPLYKVNIPQVCNDTVLKGIQDLLVTGTKDSGV